MRIIELLGQLFSCNTCRKICQRFAILGGLYYGLVQIGFTHIMMTSSNGNISASLALCAGNSPDIGEFPAQKPMTRSFDVSFDLRMNKRLSKHSWCWWFETPSRTLWRHCNVLQLRSRHWHWGNSWLWQWSQWQVKQALGIWVKASCERMENITTAK